MPNKRLVYFLLRDKIELDLIQRIIRINRTMPKNVVNLFRYECPCGKQVRFKDKRARDLSVKLHLKSCQPAQECQVVKTNFNFTENKELLYVGQTSVGDKHIHDFVVPLNELN